MNIFIIKNYSKRLIWILSLLFCFLALSSNEAKAETLDSSHVNGMFIVPGILPKLDDSNADYIINKTADIHVTNLIVQYSSQEWENGNATNYYDGDNSFLDTLFKVAEKHNESSNNKIFITVGLQVSEDKWFNDKLYKNPTELNQEKDLSISLVDKISKKYSNYDSFKGFYLPFEFNNITHAYPQDNSVPSQNSDTGWGKLLIDNYLSPVSNYIYNKNNTWDIMVSPLLYTGNNTSDQFNNWGRFLDGISQDTKINIFAPQDGLGWGNNTISDLIPWYKLAQDHFKNTKVLFYNNAESYQLNGAKKMNINKWINNIDAISPYVNGTISFSIHSIIPQNDDDLYSYKYYNAYKQYVNKQDPVNSNQLNEKVQVSINSDEDLYRKITIHRLLKDNNTASFSIYKKGTNNSVRKLTELATDEANLSFTDSIDLSPDDDYIITANSAFGSLNTNESNIDGKIINQTSLNELPKVNKLSSEDIDMPNVTFSQPPTNYGQIDSRQVLFNGDIDSFNGYALKLDGTEWYGSAIGFNKINKFDITVPLKKEKFLNSISLQLTKNADAAISIPSQINISSSLDGVHYEDFGNVYSTPISDRIGHQNIIIKNSQVKSQKSKFLKIEIIPYLNDTWTFLDEINIYSNDISDSPQKINNNTIDKKNIKLPEDFKCYSPLDPKEILFDGNIEPYSHKNIILNGSQWYNTAVGFKKSPAEIIIPFKETNLIHYVNLQIPQDKKSGIYIPQNITLFYSDDGKTYKKLGKTAQLPNFENSLDHAKISVGTISHPEQAKFIKICFNSIYGSDMFLDEVEIY